MARPLERLLKVVGSLAPPLGLRMGGAIGRSHHLLSTVLLVLLLLITMAVGHGNFVATVPTAEVGAVLALAVEAGLGGFLSYGVLGGDIRKLPCRSC